MPVSTSTAPTSTSNIWVAAGEGDLDRVMELVDNQGISPSIAVSFSYTPLHAAASYSHLPVLRFLLSHPSLPEPGVETVDSDGETCLFVCEEAGTARMLVEEYGADVYRRNNEGQTAEEVARENDREDVVAYLRSVRGGGGDDEEAQDTAPPQPQDADADTDADPAVQAALDAAIEQRTEAIMDKVGQILGRAEARVARERGQSGGARAANTAIDDEGNPEYELTEEEEKEMRDVVGEALMRQILEGWGAATNLDARGNGDGDDDGAQGEQTQQAGR